MKKTTLTSLIALAFSTQVFATTLDANEVTVTASRFKDELSSNPSVRVISHEDIENSPDRKSTRLNSSHSQQSRMPSSA